ncbi:MAG: M56 family metallopeptidase [Acutalibacteraceae bacterium]
MDKLLFKLINMSIPAGLLIIAVILLRLLFKKAPKSLRCVMWALVGIRLICPFSLESFYSLVPSAEVISPGITYSQAPQIDSGIPIINNTINPVISENLAPNIAESVSPMQVIGLVGSYVWLIGLVVMLIYALISYIKLRRTTAESQPLNKKVWLCDRINSPFILGIIRPRIYVPSAIDGDTLKNVIAHEKAHIKRLDHLWKPLGFVLLAVYWFNPLIWVAYILLCRDIELACDEKVIKNMTASDKANYSEALLKCSTRGRSIAMCPLAFGEVGVKERIKRVLSYKKPAFWIIIASILACIAAAVCFLTNPTGKDVDDKLDRYITDVILKHNKVTEPTYEFACEDHIVLGVKNNDDKTTVYMVVMFSGYNYKSGDITEESSSHIPTVITVKSDGKGGYTLDEYWTPRDGGYYTDDIKSKFPLAMQSDVFNLSDYAEKQEKSCYNKAKSHFLYRAINGEQMGLNDISKRNIYLYNPINNYNFSYSEGCVQLIYVDPDEDIDSILPISMPDITFFRDTGKCSLSLRDRAKEFSEYTYTLSDKRLVIKNVDLGYNYVFKVKGSSFIFDEKSSDKETKGDIIDGTEFVCTKAWEDESDLYGCAYIDIDNDGEMEYCKIGDGNTWYYSSLLFSAGDKYATMFQFHHKQTLRFVEDINGTVLLCGKNYEDNTTNYYSISVENNNIVLTQVGENINKDFDLTPITLNNDIGNSKPTVNSSDVIKTIKTDMYPWTSEMLSDCELVLRVKITNDLTNKNSYFSYVNSDRRNFISMRTAEVLNIYRNTTAKELDDEIIIMDYAAISDDRMLYLEHNEEQLKKDCEYLIFARGVGTNGNYLLYLTECEEKLNLTEGISPSKKLDEIYDYLVEVFGNSNSDINAVQKMIESYRKEE